MQLKMTRGRTSELLQKTTLIKDAAWDTAFFETSTWEQEYQQKLTNFTDKLNKRHQKISFQDQFLLTMTNIGVGSLIW